MACGTPVVTSNAGSLPEVIGKSSLMASPNDIDSLAQAVRRVLENEAIKNDCVEFGLKNVMRFTWEKCASDVLEIYRKVLLDDQRKI